MSTSTTPAPAAAGPGASDAHPDDEQRDTRLPFGLCAGYGAGALGVSILLNTVTVYFPALMTTVLGQSAALAGLLLTLSKLYDVFADIVIGAASDRTKSRMGRRRPYLLIGAVVSAISFVMIFVPPAFEGWALTLWMFFALVVYSTGYSLFAVPYTAMAGEMTDDYHERTRLLSFRTFFISAGQIGAGAGTAWIIAKLGGDRVGFAAMAGAAIVIMTIAFVVTFYGTRTARTVAPSAHSSHNLIEGARTLWSNKPFVILMAIKTCQYIGIAMITTTKVLFLLNVIKIGYGGLFELTLVQNATMALSLPFWVWVTRRIGKRNAYLIATGMLALLYFSWYLAGPGIPMWEVWGRGILNGVAAAGTTLVSISMLPDVMEYDRRVNGLRREGIFASFYNIVEKIGYALGAGLIGLYLSMAGYIPTMKGEIVTQPDGAITALYAGASLVPMVFVLISFFLMMTYPLDEKTLAAVRAKRAA